MSQVIRILIIKRCPVVRKNLRPENPKIILPGKNPLPVIPTPGKCYDDEELVKIGGEYKFSYYEKK
jgi:hypothetical protein